MGFPKILFFFLSFLKRLSSDLAFGRPVASAHCLSDYRSTDIAAQVLALGAFVRLWAALYNVCSLYSMDPIIRVPGYRVASAHNCGGPPYQIIVA